MVELVGLIGLVLVLAIGGIALLWALRRPAWTGFEGRTLWDWLDLLAVPALLAAASLALGALQVRLETLRAEEAAFRAYLDRIKTLDPSDPKQRAFAEAHTLAVMTQVTGPRAGRVVLMLDRLGHIDWAAGALEGADLAGAEMKEMDLAGVKFDDANLREADLEGARLAGADFEGADLRGADLEKADASGADFSEARMRGADLEGTDLRGADLRQAKGLTRAQLRDACVDATTRLPDWADELDAASEGCVGLVAE